MGDSDQPKGPKQGEQDAWASLSESDDWHGLDATGNEARGSGQSGGPLAAGNGLQLLVTAGLEVGRIYPVSRATMAVGRAKTSDIVLSDGSISREHARIERRAGGLFVLDLQSGNGTFIDGERISQATLRVGQTVGFGQVRLQLQALHTVKTAATGRAAQGTGRAAKSEPPATRGPTATGRAGVGPVRPATAPPPPAPTASPRRKAKARPSRVLGGALGALRSAFGPRLQLAALIVLLVGYLGVFWRHHGARKAAFAAVQEGAIAYAEHRWDAAEQAFVTAQALVAGYPLPQRWLLALSRARHDEAVLQDVKAALAKADLSASRALLAPLADSPLQEQVWQLEAQWREASHARILAAEAALQAHLPHEAEALLGQVDSKSNERADRVALLTWQRRLSELGPLVTAAAAFAKRPPPTVSLWEQAASQSPSMRAGLRAFKGHRAAEAPGLARRALGSPQTNEERRLLEDFSEFENLWDTGLEEHRGKRAFAAIKLFTQAKELSARLVGNKSEPRRDLDAKLSDMYYVLGMQGLASGKLVESAEALRAALALTPDHPLSLRRLQELEDRAKRMVEEAEFVRVSRPAHAKELLGQVAAILPPSHSLGGRARKLLGTL